MSCQAALSLHFVVVVCVCVPFVRLRLLLLPGGDSSRTSAKCYNFCHCLELQLEHKQNAEQLNWQFNRRWHANGIITVPPTATRTYIHTHIHTHTRGTAIVDSAQLTLKHIVYDMWCAITTTPEYRKRTSCPVSTQNPETHLVQFVSSSIAVASHVVRLRVIRQSGRGWSKNSVTGWKLQQQKQQQQHLVQ